MDEFNYLAVLISIVLGLGITQLLGAFGRWLEQRTLFEAYAPSICWAAALLIIHIQTWWSMFALRDHTGWLFIQFVVVLLQPIILYLLTTLVLPSPTAPEKNLRANYMLQRRSFFGLLAGLLIVSVFKDIIVNSALPDALNLSFHAALFAASISAIVTANETYHHVLAYMSVVFIGAYIILLFGQLV